MKNKFRALCCTVVLLLSSLCGYAQQEESIYGDVVKADVKMKYVYSLEDALKLAREQKKLIFFNCFADWAMPCHGMNQHVFSNQAFCDYMNKTFVNLFIDVTKGRGVDVAKRYGVRSFATYLVLDADGNIVHRISGGRPLPAFKDDVVMALSPKTSLKGTTELYKSGKRSKKQLLNYVTALNVAGEGEQNKAVFKEYFDMLSPKEYALKENWPVVSSLITGRDCDMFKYLVAHKADFVKSKGAETINSTIEAQYYMDVLNYAMGETPYDSMTLLDLYNEMQKAQLPDSCASYQFYKIAQMRGEKKYDEIVDYMRANGRKLGPAEFYIQSAMNFPEMSDATRANVISYYREEGAKAKGSLAKQLEMLAKQLECTDGIKFEVGTFAMATEKAKTEKKLLFVDCYTTWCGPCKMMAMQVFTLPNVGAFFNQNFVNIKVDMEKGEGRELAKKYKVDAYPTMLILDGEGNVIQRIVGALSAEELLNIAKSSLQQVDLN